MPRRQSLFAFVVLCVGVLLGVSSAVAQINTATLSGNVTDPQGLAVRGAKVTVTLLATGASRVANVDDTGHYTIVGLVPGIYKVRAESGTGFAPYENPSLQLTVGEQATFNVKLELGTQTQVVTVTTETAPIEVTRSESSQTVDERQIDNLPINGRNYINFTLLNSQTTRDMSPTIGPAPNSGLNISGARARGNMVSVDGADAGDNSVNGIRSTVSQEDVQEFQMILSNYNAEYGRATGGVVNIVTKSGTNDFHGDVFGYLRNKSFQARNPFSGQVDPTTGDLVPVKQGYTRVQTGTAFGGALKKDKTFYFFSYEYTQREETGFSSIGTGNFGVTTGDVACIANPANGTPIPLSMTSTQLATYNGVINQITGNNPANCLNPALQGTLQPVLQAAVATGASTNVAVNGDLNKNVDGTAVPMTTLLGFPNGVPGSQYFPAPVSCPTNAQINSVICFPNGEGLVPLPTSYVALDALRGNFPVMEKTSLWSARLDQRWSARNSSFIRVGVSPSEVTGIESTSQNQVFGQNAGSRTGETHYRDVNATFQHDTIFSDTAFNEFRFQFARRGLHFGYSPLDGGSDIGVNIPGYAYFGREPYSTVDRIERRFQFTDNLTKTHGRHTFKFGVDANILQLRSAKQQIFELDFGGDVNFGGINPFPAPLPGLNAVQAYGLGVPTTYIQGIGQSNEPFDNLPFGFFAQDTWRVTPKLTLNVGVRYDVEISPLFAPATAVNAAAEKQLGITEGIPRDYNNVAPRFGLAWDPKGDGKTVVRAGYGMFYDHPLLAVAFDAVTADGGRSVQLISPGGSASACGIVPAPSGPVPPGFCGGGLDTPANLNGASIFQGALNALPSMFYLPNQQRFDPLNPNSIFANQAYLSAGVPLPILPFVLPVARNFQYGYAQQANLTIERVLAGTWKISVGYQWAQGSHLNRPVDQNSTDPVLLTNNMAAADQVFTGANAFTNPLTVVVPSSPNAACPGGIPAFNVPGGGSVAFATPTGQPLAPGALGLGYTGPGCTGTPVGFIATPSFFNFFRPTGPNPSFALGVATAPGSPCAGAPASQLFNCGFTVQQALAQAAGYPIGGVPVPFNTVDAQLSDASSSYNALTVNVQKSFSRHFTLLSSYTWSHSIDNGTDLQSTLEPADSRFPYLERSNSDNDQRHRWVTSGVFQSSPSHGGDSFAQSFLSNWTLAPLIEVSSGRPYNVITGEDTRLDLGASEIRPGLTVAGAPGATTSPYISGVVFGPPDVCLTNAKVHYSVPGITPPYGCTGSLGRNTFTMPYFFQFDLRVSKGIQMGERLRLDLIADAFNLFNHTNISAVNQLCDPLTQAPTCTAGQPSAAYDARQFQFAVKLNW
ncbi:MAG TPA: TonB-dependent receptor [Terriglobales bacterium]|nr:TonB-dependent receptor [Terriglobales bacterium]